MLQFCCRPVGGAVAPYIKTGILQLYQEHSINHIYLNVFCHVINQQNVRRSEVNRLWASVTWPGLIRHGSEPQSDTVCVWNKDDLWHDESDVSLLLLWVTTICKINFIKTTLCNKATFTRSVQTFQEDIRITKPEKWKYCKNKMSRNHHV